MSGERVFEAPDLIEVMEEAVNYNRFLIEQLLGWSRDIDSVLDFGAGNGRFASALHDERVDVHAIEPDPGLRQQIEGKGVPTYESLDLVEDRHFQGIYNINVLEHLEDDAAFLRGFYRCLQPGGRLFVYVPAFPVLFSANDERVGHVRRYTRSVLVNRIRDAGFDIEQAGYVDCLGFFAGLAYRYFGNQDGGLDLRAVRLYDRVIFPMSRILDRIAWPFFGKNLLVRAIRPADRALMKGQSGDPRTPPAKK
jgi:SAM-dependent methyltransferase